MSKHTEIMIVKIYETSVLWHMRQRKSILGFINTNILSYPDCWEISHNPEMTCQAKTCRN